MKARLAKICPPLPFALILAIGTLPAFAQEFVFPPELKWWICEIQKADDGVSLEKFKFSEERFIYEEDGFATYKNRLYPVFKKWNFYGDKFAYHDIFCGLQKEKGGKYSLLGKPGDGIWFSTKADVKSIVGNEGIPFSNGRPIFSKWKKGSFKFKKGVLNGTKDDFDVVYDKIMQIKGFSSRNKARLWLLEKKLTPHHKSLLEIELIPTGLHGNIPYIGSASDLRG